MKRLRLFPQIAICCACAGLLVAGFLIERLPEPHNPWLGIAAGFTIALRPFVAFGFMAAALASLKPV